MRLVALYLVQHRLGLPLPAEVLSRWIRFWSGGCKKPRTLEQTASEHAAFFALTGPWWLEASSLPGRCGGICQESAPSASKPLANSLCPDICSEELDWKLVPLRLGSQQVRLLRSRWQQAILLYQTAYQLAVHAGASHPRRAGQVAALGQVISTFWFRTAGEKGCRKVWHPATETQLRQSFSWLEPLQQQIRDFQKHGSAAIPDDLPGPSPASEKGQQSVDFRCNSEPDAESAHWAALALLAIQQQERAPAPWQQVLQRARRRAAAQAARLSPPGKSLQSLALAWDRKRRRLLRLGQDFQQQLFQAKQQALAHWAAGAGHMVNNPLAVIAARAQMALRHTQDPALEKHLHIIQAQAGRAHRMIAGLALYAHPPALRQEWISPEDLLGELRRQFQPLAQTKNVRLTWSVAPEVLLRADRYQLAVALQALVENALTAVEPGGFVHVEARWVSAPPVPNVRPGLVIFGSGFEDKGCPVPRTTSTVGASPPAWAAAGRKPRIKAPTEAVEEKRSTAPPGETGGWLELKVEDSGPGVSLQAAPWIFDPFYSGREAGRGMGLGLCFVWRIVQQHGGTIRVDRTPSRFTLWLPQARILASQHSPRQDDAHDFPPPPHSENPVDSRNDASAC